ncbi:MAG TPA: tetratricopeptide repeat protein [Candidatus Coprenecus stercoravium]|uniref:Tetratricopeptide repeat protein n=1 Tax=Candidatus Coprenecus stercoravium TaxID=2840735 RepID=A0A9D2KAE7_9BACT|nr:tetratricopeptide repeat protein [Candidatus Coprenecus stercoravium]
MTTITEIERLIASGRLDDARGEIERLLDAEPQNAQAWFLLGGIYRRHELWGDAINAYNRAKLIDPEGPAAAAIDSIYDIIRFVNKDLMNP